jgi:uncharacterized membrane protein YphA (DoxX/SURF4 family)
MKSSSKYLWIPKILAALIMLQTLFYKFSGAAESVYIFSTLGIEPWGRYLTGSLELIASFLILIPASSWMGALLGVGLMSGAILSHFGPLGLVVQNDGGQLFVYALLVQVSCLLVLWSERSKWLPLLSIIFKL